MAIRRNKGRYTKEQAEQSAKDFQRKIEEVRAAVKPSVTDADIFAAIVRARQNGENQC